MSMNKNIYMEDIENHLDLARNFEYISRNPRQSVLNLR